MLSPRLAAAIFVQGSTFLAPLAAAQMGFIGGELTGVAAPLLWFTVGLPLSCRVLDRRPAPRVARSQRKVLRPVRL
jgi:hypothetical protein